MKLCYDTNLSFLNNPKDLGLAYKMDLDFSHCFGRKNHCLITKEIRNKWPIYIFRVLLERENSVL